MGLPEILINFKQRAATAISRSQEGIACIIVKDDTATDFRHKEYRFTTDIERDMFSAASVAAIERVMLAAPTKVMVVRISESETFATAVPVIESIRYNWLCLMDNSEGEQQAVATYIKARNNNSPNVKFKAVVYKALVTDDMHIVNFTNDKVKPANQEEIDGWLYLPRLVGVLAALPFTRSATYYTLDELESVTEPEDVNAAIDEGEFVLFNDYGKVRIGRAVNSVKTTTATVTEDMKKITIVEAMDAILEDISAEFKANYIGKFKNNYDNQALFIAAVNSYFRGLQKEDILDNGYDNEAFVDIEAQREAWLSTGREEAADWGDAKVKQMAFSSKLFLAGSIKILDAIEDLTFNVNMA